jgi:hypothetical protein
MTTRPGKFEALKLTARKAALFGSRVVQTTAKLINPNYPVTTSHSECSIAVVWPESLPDTWPAILDAPSGLVRLEAPSSVIQGQAGLASIRNGRIYVVRADDDDVIAYAQQLLLKRRGLQATIAMHAGPAR